MRLSTFVGKRYLFAPRKQTFISLITLISTLGVAVGVMALIVALAISTGFSTRIQEKIQLLNADLNLLGRWGDLNPARLAHVESVISRDSDVEAHAPLVLGTGLVSGVGTRTAKVAKLVGIDAQRQAGVVDLSAYVRGGMNLDRTPDGGHGAILGTDLASALGVDVGDEVRLVVPRMTLSPFGALPKTATLKVSGILKTDYYLYDGEFVFVSLPFSQGLLTSEGAVSAVQVRLREGADLEGAQARLTESLGSDFRVYDLLQANQEFFKALQMERLLLFLAIGLIVLVASSNIICTLILLVMEKVRDIGILRSMGASEGQVLRLFLYQGLFIGIVGTALGDLLGVSLCVFADAHRLIPLSLDVYPLPYVPFITSAGQVIWVSSFSLGVSLLATLYPAYRASSLDPVEALRYA